MEKKWVIGEVANVEGLALMLGYRARSLLIIYLGLPFGSFHKLVMTWYLMKENLCQQEKAYLVEETISIEKGETQPWSKTHCQVY